MKVNRRVECIHHSTLHCVSNYFRVRILSSQFIFLFSDCEWSRNITDTKLFFNNSGEVKTSPEFLKRPLAYLDKTATECTETFDTVPAFGVGGKGS